tara:strand:- start:102 stop:533 length:432 start_codon:yes stop_codon:yes gene_type:complete
MKLKNKFIIIYFIIFSSISHASENFFHEAKKLFEDKKIENSKFLFQRNLVFNPKHAESYLYLAKIYEIEKNEKEKEKNLNSTLLIQPDNEEAMYMMIDIELNRSNFSEVKKLKYDFEKICSSLCEKIVSIEERLNNFENSNES